MIGLYIFSALVSAYLHKVNFKSQRNVMVFFLGLGALYAILQYLFKECSSETVLTMWIPYLGLFIAGFVLGKSEVDHKRGILSLLFVTGLLATILLNFLHFYFLFTKNFNFFSSPGCISHYSDYYLSINVLLMAIPAFLLLLKFNYDSIKDTVIGKFIRSVSKALFGIFLIHILVIQILDSNLHLFDPIAPAWLYIFIKIGVVFSISYVLTLIILKIPILNRVIGAKG